MLHLVSSCGLPFGHHAALSPVHAFRRSFVEAVLLGPHGWATADFCVIAQGNRNRFLLNPSFFDFSYKAVQRQTVTTGRFDMPWQRQPNSIGCHAGGHCVA